MLNFLQTHSTAAITVQDISDLLSHLHTPVIYGYLLMGGLLLSLLGKTVVRHTVEKLLNINIFSNTLCMVFWFLHKEKHRCIKIPMLFSCRNLDFRAIHNLFTVNMFPFSFTISIHAYVIKIMSYSRSFKI